MEEKQPEITFKLARIEDLDSSDRAKVEGLTDDMKEGFVIKEYRSNSFVKLKRFVPINNLITAQIKKELNEKSIEVLKSQIAKNLAF